MLTNTLNSVSLNLEARTHFSLIFNNYFLISLLNIRKGQERGKSVASPMQVRGSPAV